MKISTLILAILLINITSVSAKNADVFPTDTYNTLSKLNYRNSQAITFEENNIKFSVFTDGSFDFNTEAYNAEVANTFPTVFSKFGTNHIPGIVFRYENIGLIVQYNAAGKVIRVGNVYINYDKKGRIKRSGSVDMKYKNGKLNQIGDLEIIYNNEGKFTGTNGFVNTKNRTSNNSLNSDDWFYNTNSYQIRKKEKENMKRRYTTAF